MCCLIHKDSYWPHMVYFSGQKKLGAKKKKILVNFPVKTSKPENITYSHSDCCIRRISGQCTNIVAPGSILMYVYHDPQIVYLFCCLQVLFEIMLGINACSGIFISYVHSIQIEQYSSLSLLLRPITMNLKLFNCWSVC